MDCYSSSSQFVSVDYEFIAFINSSCVGLPLNSHLRYYEFREIVEIVRYLIAVLQGVR